MAALYGRLQGGRGEATRTGTKSSGIRATLETWEGKIRVDLEADGSFTVAIGPKDSFFRSDGEVVAHGNVGDDGRYLRTGSQAGPWYCCICKGQIVGGPQTGWKHAGPTDQGHGSIADAEHQAIPDNLGATDA